MPPHRLLLIVVAPHVVAGCSNEGDNWLSPEPCIDGTVTEESVGLEQAITALTGRSASDYIAQAAATLEGYQVQRQSDGQSLVWSIALTPMGATLITPGTDAVYGTAGSCIAVGQQLQVTAVADLSTEDGWSGQGDMVLTVSLDANGEEQFDLTGLISLDPVPASWVEDAMNSEYALSTVDRASLTTFVPVGASEQRNPLDSLQWEGSVSGESSASQVSALMYRFAGE